MKLLVLSEPVERARFAEVVAGEGFVASADVPWTHGVRYTTWARGEDRITFATDAASGAALVRIDEAEGAALGDAMAARFPGQDPAAVIAAARAAVAPRDRIRAMFRAGSLTLVPGPWVDDVAALLRERLSDGEPLVRWAAAHLLGEREDEGWDDDENGENGGEDEDADDEEDEAGDDDENGENEGEDDYDANDG